MSPGKEKLMIVGAGKFQVPIIKLARQMGFETVVVSVAGNYPGFLIADKSYEVDVREKEAILEIARKEGIRGVVTDQTDLPVPTVAYVAEKLGLPGIGYECALNISDKVRCRQYCQRIGFPIPAFFQTASLDEAMEGSKEIGFPLVVKPPHSQGSRGVSKVNQPDELPEKFQNAVSYSATGTALLEEFSEGDELLVVGFVSDFKYTNLGISDLKHFDLSDKFIWRQSLFPALLEEDLRQIIEDLDRRLYESFGPRFGIVFSQYRVNRTTGKIHLMEAAIRGPASLQTSHAVPLVCGIDVLPLQIELVSGRRESVDIDKEKVTNRAAGVAYFHLPEGVISRLDGIEEIESLPGVHGLAPDNLAIGTKTEPIRDSTGRKGPVVFAGEDREDCEAVIRRVRETLRIEIETEGGTGYPIWE
jgi:carbamoyl-phosphate synthase large subunit